MAVTSRRGVRIGLAVSRDSLRAVAVRGGRVLWAMQRELGGSALTPALCDFLASLPRRRWRRTVVIAAVGPDLAQTRRLSGLPPVGDARMLRRLVSENASRFFLRNGVPLLTGGLDPAGDGSVWASACERPVMDAIAAACRGSGLHLGAVLPAVAALGFVVPNGHVTCGENCRSVEVEFAAGRLVRVRRLVGRTLDVDPAGVSPSQVDPAPHAASPAPRGPEPPEALAALGSDAWRFAAAYGAALAPASHALALGGGHPSVDQRDVPRWRAVLAHAAVASGLVAALLAPSVSAMRDERRTRVKLVELSAARTEAVAAAEQLRRVSAALEQISRFETERWSPTLVLAHLTRTLPAGAAVVAVRLDSAGGTIVALAPHAAAVLAALERMPEVAAPEMIGPVTRELVGTRDIERVTVRFRWAPQARGSAP